MPYTKDTPVCKHYMYDTKKTGWYCSAIGIRMYSRVECKHCPYLNTCGNKED